MGTLTGQSIAVTATVQTVKTKDTTRAHTLFNDGTDAAFYYSDPKVAATLAGDAAALRDLFCGELLPGESVVLDPPISSFQIVCATGLTTTVRMLPGRVSAALAVSFISPPVQTPVATVTINASQVSATLPANCIKVHFSLTGVACRVVPASSAPSEANGCIYYPNIAYHLDCRGATKLYASRLAATEGTLNILGFSTS